jgi:hypothetical protein
MGVHVLEGLFEIQRRNSCDGKSTGTWLALGLDVLVHVSSMSIVDDAGVRCAAFVAK